VIKRSGLFVLGAGVIAAAALMLGSGVAAATRASSGPLPTMTLRLNGKSIKVGGSTVSGAVKMVTTVTGEKQGEPTLFHLNQGVSPADFGKAVATVGAHHGDLNYLDPYGQLVFNIGANKGKSSAQGLLPAGNYFALDTVKSGGSPPHAYFTVTQSSSPAALPKPGATFRTIEFAFRGPKKIHDGELLRMQNDGFLVHMDLINRIKSAADARKLLRLLREGKDGKAGNLLVGPSYGAGPLSTGAKEQVRVTEPPGTYVQICLMQTQDGRDHTLLGMERIFKIVK
jgi:hypothetical protein